MNGKPSNRKKKPATIATIDGVKLTAEQPSGRQLYYEWVNSLSAPNRQGVEGFLSVMVSAQIGQSILGYATVVMGDLITILHNGGMPQEQAKVRAAEIVKGAMEKFRDSEAVKAKATG